MLIRIAILLLLGALGIFILMAVSFSFGYIALAEIIRAVAAETMFLGSGLIVITALGFLLRSVYQQLRHYFSAPLHAQRRAWYISARKHKLAQLLSIKKKQLNYFRELKQLHLLRTDNARQVRALEKSVYRDLKRVKDKMPHSDYQKIKQQMQLCRQQCDLGGLVNLQQQLDGYR